MPVETASFANVVLPSERRASVAVDPSTLVLWNLNAPALRLLRLLI